MGPLLHIFGSFEAIFLETTYVDNQLWFWKYYPVFSFLIWPYLGLFAFFRPFRAIFGAGFRFKNFFGAYLYRQSTLVLEVQPYLFVFNLATFGASFELFLAFRGYLFDPLALFFGVGSGSKTFLGHTYVDNQLCTFLAL